MTTTAAAVVEKRSATVDYSAATTATSTSIDRSNTIENIAVPAIAAAATSSTVDNSTVTAAARTTSNLADNAEAKGIDE